MCFPRSGIALIRHTIPRMNVDVDFFVCITPISFFSFHNIYILPRSCHKYRVEKCVFSYPWKCILLMIAINKNFTYLFSEQQVRGSLESGSR